MKCHDTSKVEPPIAYSTVGVCVCVRMYVDVAAFELRVTVRESPKSRSLAKGVALY